MDIIMKNYSWMAFNMFLAVIPVFFGWLFLKERRTLLKWIFGIIWILFLPNTIYIFTDLGHIFRDWSLVDGTGKIYLLTQYAVLEAVGFLTFILALYPFEKYEFTSRIFRKKNLRYKPLIFLNFLIGFGIVLGRVERINSWDVIFKTQDVINAAIHIFQTPELILLTILFGLFANFCYFLFRKPIIVYFSFDK